MDDQYNSRDEERNTIMILIYGLISLVVARHLARPSWLIIALISLIMLQAVFMFYKQIKGLLVVEGLILALTLVIGYGTPFMPVIVIFGTSYAVLRWIQRSSWIVFAGFLTGIGLLAFSWANISGLLEQASILVLLSIVIFRFGRELNAEKCYSQAMEQEISTFKDEAVSQQISQDEKFKELLAAKVSMEERYAELYTLQIINDVANSELSIDILGEKVVDILTGLTGSSACSVILSNPEQDPSILASNITSLAQKEALLTPEALELFHRIIEGEEKSGLTPKQKAFLRSRGTRSYVVVPLRLKTGGLGIIFAEHSVDNAFNLETRKILMTAADRLAIAIDNARLYDRMERMAVTDALTGVYNRLYLHQYLFKLFQNDNPESLALVIFDADHFKKVNDTYGHLTGDTTLKKLAAIAKGLLPPRGLVARYGGEEFVMIVPEYDADRMRILAETVREKVAVTPIRAENGTEFYITISLGVSAVPTYAASAETLLETADQALYRAKQNGRNQVCMAAL